MHHLLLDPHSTDHVQQQQQPAQQHSTITTNMALTAEREAYLRLATHSMENSRRIAPHFNVQSPKAYGGYVVSIELRFLYLFNQLNLFEEICLSEERS